MTSKTGSLEPLFLAPGENEVEGKEIRKNNKCVL